MLCSFEKEKEKTIDDLPDEILEYILSLVSPYKDSESCRNVCRRWARAIKCVSQYTRSELYRAIMNHKVVWNCLVPPTLGPTTTVTKRYSHVACYCDNVMYVFGGCTLRCTMFNDLWTLDLGSRKWVRPYSRGSYPSPKACATMCRYKKNLVLFGGWTHPPPYPLHQIQRLFNELHMYEIASNTWSVIHSNTHPPPMAGHSATIHGNKMIVFGGLQWGGSLFLYSSSNDIWCFNFDTQVWSKAETTETKPDTRYGQSQIFLDNDHLMIMGGCQGPNAILDDVWILDMSQCIWVWKQLQVNNPRWAAPHLWCHPACRVDDVVVVFSSGISQAMSHYTCSVRSSPPSPSQDANIPPEVLARRESQGPLRSEKDVNVNGQRGRLGKKTSYDSDDSRASTSSGSTSNVHLSGDAHLFTGENSSPGPNSPVRFRLNDSDGDQQPHYSGYGGRSNGDLQLAAFRSEAGSSSNSRNRAKQLESLRKMEQRYKNPFRAERIRARRSQPDPNDPNPGPFTGFPINKMNMYVMDISDALTEDASVTWRPPRSHRNAPRDTVFHSLVLGKGELIIFGGVQKSSSSSTVPVASYKAVSNNTHVISAARKVV